MNLPRLDRKTIIIASMFAAPVLTMQLAYPLNSIMGTPQTASATPALQPMPIEAPIVPIKVTDQQRAAAAHIASLRNSSDSLATPFYYAPKPEEALTVDPVVLARSMPQFRISSILEAHDGQILAMLNGKMCAVGSQPMEGWTITSIDPDAKTVTVTADETGETLVLKFGRQRKSRS